ncbi:MBL fold metallo-hydrolase [Rhodobacterales bacterium]|nr:MBL fold metallo-hydrolase [Rhodobacterales bacterium]
MIDRYPSAPSLALGDVTVSSLSDGFLDIPADYFPDATPTERRMVSPVTRFGANVWLVTTPTRKILIDAGSGDWLKQRFPETGQLAWPDRRDGAAHGITDIVLTHMHADHIGGLVTGSRSLFPEATLHVQEEEWNYWTDESLAERSSDAMKPAINLVQTLARRLEDQVTRHEGAADLGEGVMLRPAPGHTPGHQIVHLASGKQQALLLGDAVVSQDLQVANPEARYALETDPALAAETRKSLFAWIACDKIPFAATHLRTAAYAHLEKEGDGYRFSGAAASGD